MTDRKVAFLLLALCIASWVSLCCAEDFYATLGVPRDATTKQIRKAYRDLSLQWHPDKNKGNEEAAKKYAQINNAYEVLTNEEKRRIYDQYGEEGLSKGGAPQQHQHGFFNNFFNFGHQQHGAEAMRKGADIGLPLFVSLEDLYNGKTITVAHRKQILCTKCRGTGAKDPNDVKTCPDCGGKGIKVETKKVGPGFIQQMQTTCNVCGGKGTTITSKCPHCHGTKIEIGEEQLVMVIERGMPDQHKIRFEQEADEAPDTVPGDLYFTIVTLEHDRFSRKGNDLYLKEKITLLEALTGFQKTITHLDGHVVTLSRQAVTIPGFVQTIKDEGMPMHEFPSQRGNLYVEYTVVFPQKLTEAQKEGFKKLLS